MIRKKITKKVRVEIEKRSKKLCECCGVDIVVDKHHILEVCNGGPDTVDNLIALCPNCHRQIPKDLNTDQQVFIKKIVNEKRQSVTHDITSNLNCLIIGSNKFINNKSILKINGQNIIRTVEKDGRFYANIILLEGFNHYLLVLNNRVIIGGNVSITSDSQHLKIMKDGEKIYEIFKENEGSIPVVNFKFKFKGLDFIAENDYTSIPNLFIQKSTFRDNDTCINFNLS